MKLPIALCVIFASVVYATKLQEVFMWKEVSFAWPSEVARMSAIAAGHYIPKNNLPLGLEVYKNKLFITVPRWKSGVAASLNYVDINSHEDSPALIPYPSWEANRLPVQACHQNCTEDKDKLTIVSVFRLKVDVCDRLWVVDTGSADLRGNETKYAEQSLIIFDLLTDQVIRRYTFKKSDLNDKSFFANIALDVQKNDCDNAFAYIPDMLGYGVVVYSYAQHRSWRITHNFFHFDPLSGNFDVAGINFQWKSGVFTLTAGPDQPDGSRDVYFHPFVSTKEFSVSSRVLQNETHATSHRVYHDFRLVGDRGPLGQSSSEAYDNETDVIFYGLPNKDAVGCWSLQSPYNPETQGIVDSDNETLVFVNDLIVNNGYVWVLSDRLPIFLYKSLNPNEYNYRVLKGKTSEVIQGTPCETSMVAN